MEKIAKSKSIFISNSSFLALAKSGSESSISEACDKEEPTQPPPAANTETKVKKDETPVTIRKDMLDIPMPSAAKRGSLTSAKSLHELKRDAMDEQSDRQAAAGTSADVRNEEPGGKPKGIRPSKSETSIIESFVVVEKRNNANYLRDGEHKSEKFEP